eukprot:TRINITY_DN5657_c0_g1_i1.p1 TRINITY_DN5657_c0_g1~~TRINITY_DN5657_c0_g1_i1.p1  ORF type:complete len:500 (-),score=187.92 TRINITY_DN5657_c0_g1_i1:301-1800(-)
MTRKQVKRKDPPKTLVQQSLKFAKEENLKEEPNQSKEENATTSDNALQSIVPKEEESNQSDEDHRLESVDDENKIELKQEDKCEEWPAPVKEMQVAKEFFTETVKNLHKVLIVPDKDADGLSSGVIVYRTLLILGLPEENIKIHFVSKGSSVHTDEEKERMEAYGCTRLFVLDQGSRGGREIVDPQDGKVQTLIIDHHHSRGEHPDFSTIVSAQFSYPIATSSLLTFEVVRDLHPKIVDECDWLAAVGVFGDLSSSVKFEPPWPDFSATFKKYTKSKINKVVSLVNAPRRTPQFNPEIAWKALLRAKSPSEVLESGDSEELRKAREMINGEVSRWSKTPPVFNDTGTIALIRINSPCQIHPVVATRWSNSIKSSKLIMLMCSNSGYLKDSDGSKKVNFSCRIPKVLKESENRPNLQDILMEYSSKIEGFREKNPDFARGHREATGGILSEEDFESLMMAMRIGFKVEKPPPKIINGGSTLEKFGFMKPKAEEVPKTEPV